MSEPKTFQIGAKTFITLGKSDVITSNAVLREMALSQQNRSDSKQAVK